MISDISLVLDAIKKKLDPHFESVFTETKTKISPNEFPAVIMTLGDGFIQMKSDNYSLINVSLQIDVMDSGRDIQEALIVHTNNVVEALNPFIKLDDLESKAYPQSFSFSYDEEDSRIGTSSITYNLTV